MTATELREQAARAERLAWAVSDGITTERLLTMCREYRQLADAIDTGRPELDGHGPRMAKPS